MNELVLKNFSGQIEITPTALKLKQDALAAAKLVAKVETPEQQLTAVAAMKLLKELRNGMELTRKAVKKPVLDLGREIDALAQDFMQKVEKQAGRISGLINHYQRKQLELVAKEEEKITEQAATAAELHKLATKALVDGYIEEAKKLKDQAFDLEMQTEVAVMPGIEKPRGLVVRNKINFQVTDAIVFAQAWPQYWRISKNGDHENECMTVDRMRVLDELNKEGGGEFHQTQFPEELSQTEDRRLVQPAGLRVYRETKAHVR